MLTDTVFLYFFSASFQGLAAILGLLAIFGIFRLQQLGAKVDGVRGLLYADRGRSTWPSEVAKFDALNYADKLKHYQAKDPKTYGTTLLPLLKVWLDAEGEMLALREALWKPVALLAGVTSFNLCALPFSVGLSQLPGPVKWATVVIDVGASVGAIWWNLLRAKGLLDGNAKRW